MSAQFSPGFLQNGPILGAPIHWLHHGQPGRLVRFGRRNRAISSMLFTGVGPKVGSSPGNGAYGSNALTDGPEPMYPGGNASPQVPPLEA